MQEEQQCTMRRFFVATASHGYSAARVQQAHTACAAQHTPVADAHFIQNAARGPHLQGKTGKWDTVATRARAELTRVPSVSRPIRQNMRIVNHFRSRKSLRFDTNKSTRRLSEQRTLVLTQVRQQEPQTRDPQKRCPRIATQSTTPSSRHRSGQKAAHRQGEANRMLTCTC